MTDRLGQSAIFANAIAGVRETAPTAATPPANAMKFNPGYGVYDGFGPADLTTTLTSLGNIPSVINDIDPMSNVVYLLHHFSWGALESARDVYTFNQTTNLVDSILDLCQAAGKRFVMVVMYSYNSAGSAAFNISSGRFPAYLRDDFPSAPGHTDGGLMSTEGDTTIPPRCDARIHIPAIMDRYLALHQALADKYNDHPWFEAISTYDSVPSTIIKKDPTWNVTDYVSEMLRCIPALRTMWSRTNVWYGVDSGIFSDFTRGQAVLNALRDNAMVPTGPDVATNEFFGAGDGGTFFQRIYQGLAGGHDYRGELCSAWRNALGNCGPPRVPTVAQLDPTLWMDQLWYPTHKTTLNARWISVPYKNIGVGGTTKNNDHFWNTAATGFTLIHPTFKEFLLRPASAIAINTTKPPNYPGPVITGGT